MTYKDLSLKTREISNLIDDNTLTINKLIDFLVDNKLIKKVELKFPHKRFTRYLFRDASELEIASSLFKDAYLSHYSAAYYHGLINKKINNVYINKEQSPKPRNKDNLEQSNIDKAFSRPMRASNTFAKYGKFNIYLLSGKKTGNLGVISDKGVNVTDLERTLIDIAVRPIYAGSINNIVQIYKNAKGKVSVAKIKNYLDKLDYIYPYHQVIGFYLDICGYEESDLSIMESLPMEYKFYLTYNMSSKEYSERWKVFYPTDLLSLFATSR